MRADAQGPDVIDPNAAVRALLAFVSGIAALYFVYWAGGALVYAAGLSFWISYLASLAAGALVAREVWSRTAAIGAGFANTVVVAAFVTGAVGFLAGFFGSLMLAPGANQGPLLGLFITGPLGFVAGGIGGAVYWFAQNRRQPDSLQSTVISRQSTDD
jgi:hypothetical protein